MKEKEKNWTYKCIKKSKIENKTKNRKAIQVRSFKNIEKDIKRTGKKNKKNGRKICKYIKKLFDKKEKTNKKKWINLDQIEKIIKTKRKEERQNV